MQIVSQFVDKLKACASRNPWGFEGYTLKSRLRGSRLTSFINLLSTSDSELLVATNSLLYLLAVGVNRGMPFLLIPLLTKYLTVEEYGYVGIAMVIVGLLRIVVGLNPSLFVITKFSSLDRQEMASYISHSLLLVLVMFVLVDVALGVCANILREEYAMGFGLLIVLAGTASLMVVEALVLTVIQMEKRAQEFLLFSIISACLQFFLVLFLVVWMRGGWKSKVIADLLASVVVALVLLRRLKRTHYVGVGYSWRKMKHLFSFSLPLLPHVLSLWGMNFIDRFILAELVDVEAVGLYSAAYTIGMGMMLLYDAMQRAWQPYFFESLEKEDMRLKVKIVRYTWMYYLGCIILYFISAWAIRLFGPHFLGSKFQTAIQFVPMIFLGYTFHGMYRAVASYLYHINRNGLLASVTVVSVLLNVVLNYVLISRNGTMGAAQATAFTFLFSFVAVQFLVMRFCDMPWFTFLKYGKKSQGERRLLGNIKE